MGIGECWLRGISKLVLREVGGDAKMACGSAQLCAGLKAGIEGALHACITKGEAMEAMNFEEWEVNDNLWREEA